MEKARMELLFSTARLESYQSKEEHFANLRLIGKIAPKLCMLEICIRNIVNNILSQRLGDEWCESESQAKYRGKIFAIISSFQSKILGFGVR